MTDGAHIRTCTRSYVQSCCASCFCPLSVDRNLIKPFYEFETTKNTTIFFVQKQNKKKAALGFKHLVHGNSDRKSTPASQVNISQVQIFNSMVE